MPSWLKSLVASIIGTPRTRRSRVIFTVFWLGLALLAWAVTWVQEVKE